MNNLPLQQTTRAFTARDFAERQPEGCGVFAVFNHPHAARLTALGLHSLQHRGQESAGIAVSDGQILQVLKGQGLVSEVMRPEAVAKLDGMAAIGHVRYSTTGGSMSCNAQPLMANYRAGRLAVAHNGNLTNSAELAAALEEGGAIFQSTTDTELLLHLIAQNRESNFQDALHASLRQLHGAYSMVLLRERELWAFRDARGFRPLCLGRLGDAWVVSSESCGLDLVGAQYLRELEPGETIVLRPDGIDRQFPLKPAPEAFCVFEMIYYSRPDSHLEGHSIYEYRLKLGRELAREHPADADFVIAVPDSSTAAAQGYARESGLRLEAGLIRSHYIGRTFIAPDQETRSQAARLKFNPVRDILAGRRVVVIDDSIVRGTTSRAIMAMLREAGVKEVHLRISAPPWRYPCCYGIDTPDEDKLLASGRSVEEMRAYLGVDSLGFLSYDGVLRATPKTMEYCNACFTGRYPDRRPTRASKAVLEERIP